MYGAVVRESMSRALSVVCDDDTAEAVERLAREHGLSRAEVLGQLVRIGLAEVQDDDL